MAKASGSTLIFADPVGPIIWDLSLALHPEALERRGLLLRFPGIRERTSGRAELLGHANRGGILVLAFM